MSIDLTGYQLTFDEEFNTFSASPDGTNTTWETKYWWGGRNPTGTDFFFLDPSVGGLGQTPYSISNGVLDIHAQPTTPALQAAGVTVPFTTGQIDTHNSFSQEYGYFEMRAKMPSTYGTNSAFWLLPENGAWPPEIDAEEVLGRYPTMAVLTNHTNVTGTPTQVSSTSTGPDLTAGFHTYGLLWTASTITWYMDGQQVFTTPTTADEHQAMYMLATMSIGGDWAGNPNPSGFSADYQIDYIRAYSSDPNAVAVKPQPGYNGPGAISPDGSTLTPGQSGSLITTDGTWTFSTATAAGGNIILLNGQPATNGTAVELVVENGYLYSDNSLGNWYEWINSGWTATSNPMPTSSGSGPVIATPFATPTPVEARTTVNPDSTGTAHGTTGADGLYATGSGQTLIGNGGDDVFHIGGYTNTTIQETGTGISTVKTWAGTYTLQAGINDLTAEANNYAHHFTGNAGNNVITGSNANDVLNGGGGNDSFVLGTGANTVTGGGTGAQELFIFSAGADHNNTITDFHAGSDMLDLRPLMQAIGYKGTDPVADHILQWTETTGGDAQLQLDPTGAAGAAHLLVTLQHVQSSALKAGVDYLWH